MQHSAAAVLDAKQLLEAAKLQWAMWWKYLQSKSSGTIHRITSYAGTMLVSLGNRMRVPPNICPGVADSKDR